uniref:Centriole, cilia and spindle associated protein n=1 Tax=Otus sunia TaxID=257818 RepID=A0A8C8BV16_9STRI
MKHQELLAVRHHKGKQFLHSSIMQEDWILWSSCFHVFLLFNVLQNADSAFSVDLHLPINNEIDFKFSLTNSTYPMPGGQILDTCYGRLKKHGEHEKTVEHTSVKEADKTSRTGRRPSRSALSSRNDRRSAKSPQKTDAPKENKHPFALYGWGERQTDTGSQKTHNVCASASANEIHESALRAKNRRQVEKRKLSQRRVRSAEAEKAWRIKSSPPDNPWMTEYMRCYSARAR